MKAPEQINIRTAALYWLLTICYMGIIFYFSSLKSYKLPDLSGGIDKAVHIVIYTILAFLCFLSFSKSGLQKNIFLTTFLLVTLYGITDELHQLYIPGRVASISDIFADSFGALIGSFLARIISYGR